MQIESCVRTVIGCNSVTCLMDHKKAEVLRDSHCLEKNDKELMIMFPGAERWQKGSGGSVFCQVPAKEQDIVSSSIL